MEYPGVVILASHDRYMLDKLADHLFVLEGDGVVKDFPGGYTAYAIWKEEQGEEYVEEIPDPKVEKADSSADRQEVRKALRRAEKSMEQLEQQKKKLEENFLKEDPSLDDLQKWDKELKETKVKLHEVELTWMELSEQLEAL
jgi:ATP-binding cassette subfamily F protein uup